LQLSINARARELPCPFIFSLARRGVSCGGSPRSASEILNRLNELSFNAVLLKELPRQVADPGNSEGAQRAGMRGTGFGILDDLLMGITGAFIGSWLVPQLGLHLGTRDHTAPNGPRGPARDDDVLMGRMQPPAPARAAIWTKHPLLPPRRHGVRRQ
jgi:hypothetical protein